MAVLSGMRPDLMPHFRAALLSLPGPDPSLRMPVSRRMAAIFRLRGVQGIRRELTNAVAYRLNGTWRRHIEPLVVKTGLARKSIRIEAFCETHGIPYTYTRDVNAAETLTYLESVKPDVLLVMTFHHILRAPAFNLARLAALNCHTSLLPAFRGAYPIRDALQAAVSETGVTLHSIDEGIDTGDIVGQAAVAIPRRCTEAWLRRRLAERGAALVATCLDQLIEGKPIARIPQAAMDPAYEHRHQAARSKSAVLRIVGDSPVHQ